MYLDFSVTRRDTCLVDRTKGFKIIEVIDLPQFQEISILQVGVSIISIKHHCLIVITRNLHPKLDLHYITSLLSLGSLEEAVHILSVIHISKELLSSRFFMRSLSYASLASYIGSSRFITDTKYQVTDLYSIDQDFIS